MKYHVLAVIIFLCLLTACASNEQIESIVPPVTESQVVTTPAQTPTPPVVSDVLPDLTPEITVPAPVPTQPVLSAELQAFAEVLLPRTENTPSSDRNRWLLDEYITGEPLSHKEYNELALGLRYDEDFANVLKSALMTTEEFDAIPMEDCIGASYVFAQKPVRVDVNGDGQPEVVLVTRTGAGSEGDSVSIYSVSNGVYGKEYGYKLDFFLGMNNKAKVTEYGGAVFIVVEVPSYKGIDTEVSPDENGELPAEAELFTMSYMLMRYFSDWSREDAFLSCGEFSEWEYDWTEMAMGE